MNTQRDQPSSRNIPLPVKREVRKRCGFGCVICGMPLFEYDHMTGWAQVREHIAQDITLLCDKHHKEKTHGLLPLEHVRDANASPYNLRLGVSKPYDLHFSSRTPEVLIGSNKFITELKPDRLAFIPIIIDGEILIGFFWLDDHILLQLKFFDEYNHLVLLVFDNQLVYSVGLWDIELIGKRLIIRDGPGKIFLEIEFEPPGRVFLRKGRMLCNGVDLEISSERIKINNSHVNFEGLMFKNIMAGICIGENPPPGTVIALEKIPRYPQCSNI